MTLPDDRDLLARSKADHAAFEQLVLRYQDRIYTLCRYMLRDTEDAQDAAQDAFLKAYAALGTFAPGASLSTWLYRIAVNTCLDYNKKSRPEPVDDDSAVDNLPSPQPSPERLSQSKETGRLIEGALGKLPGKLRAAIVLKEIEGLSYEEIAHTLATSVGTVKSRISRAREELRRLLQKEA